MTRAVGGILLTGGASRRMGHAKAALVVGGEQLAGRLARLLAGIAEPAVEVGPGWTALPSVLEEQRGSGPLAAVVAGAEALRRAGHRGPAIVLACDLPLADRPLLEFLAGAPGQGTALPVVAGRDQPLCARWSAADLDAATSAYGHGERSLRALPDRATATLLGEARWPPHVTARSFADADDPEDLAALGVAWKAGTAHPARR